MSETVDDPPAAEQIVKDFETESGAKIKEALITPDGEVYKKSDPRTVKKGLIITQVMVDNAGEDVGTLSYNVSTRGQRQRVTVVRAQLEVRGHGVDVYNELELSDSVIEQVFNIERWSVPRALLRPDALEEDYDFIASMGSGTIVVKDNMTQLQRQTKDGPKYEVLLCFTIVRMLTKTTFLKTFSNEHEKKGKESMAEVGYELLCEYTMHPEKPGILVANNEQEINLAGRLDGYGRVRVPVTVSNGDLNDLKTLVQRFSSSCSLLVPEELQCPQFRKIINKMQADYTRRGGKGFTAVEVFHAQPLSDHLPTKTYVSKTCAAVVNADGIGAKFVPLDSIGLKYVAEVVNFDPKMTPKYLPVEEPIVRLRILRTAFNYGIRYFCGRANVQSAMNATMQSFNCAHFNELQRDQSGFALVFLVSFLGSIGKSEFQKFGNCFWGMGIKGLVSFVSEAGYFQLQNKLRNCMLHIDDVQTEKKEGRARGFDGPMSKMTYDAQSRVVHGKVSSITSGATFSGNNDPNDFDAPSWTRVCRYSWHKGDHMSSKLLEDWRKLQEVIPCLVGDIISFPYNRARLQECEAMCIALMINPHSQVAMRSAQNQAAILDKRIRIGWLLGDGPVEIDDMFRSIAIDANQTAVAYSEGAGLFSRFRKYFQQAQRVSNPKDPRGQFVGIPNLRDYEPVVDENELWGTEFYAVIIEDMVKVMYKLVPECTPTTLPIRGLKATLKQMRADGARQLEDGHYFYNSMCDSAFPAVYQPPYMDGEPRPEVRVYRDEDLGTFEHPTADITRRVTDGVWALPKQLLDRNATEEAIQVDFKTIMIPHSPDTGEKFNLYEAVVNGTWAGITEVKERTELGRAVVEYDLFDRDDFTNSEVQKTQMELVRNIARTYLPKGQYMPIPRPKGFRVPKSFGQCFYTGHPYKPLLGTADIGHFLVVDEAGVLKVDGSMRQNDGRREAVKWAQAQWQVVPFPGCKIVSVEPWTYGRVVACDPDDETVRYTIQNPPPAHFVDEEEGAELIKRNDMREKERRQRMMLGEDEEEEDDDVDFPPGGGGRPGDDDSDDDDFGGAGGGGGGIPRSPYGPGDDAALPLSSPKDGDVPPSTSVTGVHAYCSCGRLLVMMTLCGVCHSHAELLVPPAAEEDDEEMDAEQAREQAMFDGLCDYIIQKNPEEPPSDDVCRACKQQYADPLQSIVCNSCMPFYAQRFRQTAEYAALRGNGVLDEVEQLRHADEVDDEEHRRHGVRAQHVDGAAALMAVDEQEGEDGEFSDDGEANQFIADKADDGDEQPPRKKRRVVIDDDDDDADLDLEDEDAVQEFILRSVSIAVDSTPLDQLTHRGVRDTLARSGVIEGTHYVKAWLKERVTEFVQQRRATEGE